MSLVDNPLVVVRGKLAEAVFERAVQSMDIPATQTTQQQQKDLPPPEWVGHVTDLLWTYCWATQLLHKSLTKAESALGVRSTLRQIRVAEREEAKRQGMDVEEDTPREEKIADLVERVVHEQLNTYLHDNPPHERARHARGAGHGHNRGRNAGGRNPGRGRARRGDDHNDRPPTRGQFAAPRDRGQRGRGRGRGGREGGGGANRPPADRAPGDQRPGHGRRVTFGDHLPWRDRRASFNRHPQGGNGYRGRGFNWMPSARNPHRHQSSTSHSPPTTHTSSSRSRPFFPHGGHSTEPPYVAHHNPSRNAKRTRDQSGESPTSPPSSAARSHKR